MQNVEGDGLILREDEEEETKMRLRYFVTEHGRRFASIHATTPEEAIQIACRMTGRDPMHCAVEQPSGEKTVAVFPFDHAPEKLSGATRHFSLLRRSGSSI